MSSELERLPPPVDDGHHMLVWAAAEMCRAAHYEGTDEYATRRLIAAGKHIKEHADKMKFGMAQANSTIRQQLAAATERLAAAERCVEFFFGCQVQIDIPRTCVGFTALRDGRFASTRWKLNEAGDPIRRQEFNIRDNALDAWLDAESANWLPAE